MLKRYTNKADKGIKLMNPQSCKCCGKVHEFIPSTAFSDDGLRHWFNCVCNSTLIVRMAQEEAQHNTIYTNETIRRFRIVFISRRLNKISCKELLELETKIRCNNKSKGVTGLLLFNDSYFIGSLEGERSHLNELFIRVARDSRHGDLEILRYEEVEKLYFSEWRMSILNPVRSIEGVRERYCKTGVFNPYYLTSEEILLVILASYEDRINSEKHSAVRA